MKKPVNAASHPRSLQRAIREDERGTALALVAISLVVLLGMAALAIDLGLLFEARNQAQRSADAAALAGASALQTFGNDPAVVDEAVARAMEYAAENPVQGVPVSVEPSDVEVDLENWSVTVTVHRTTERGNAVPTQLARVLGIDEANVNARATAAAVEAGGVNCLLPLAIPDRWFDSPDTPDGTFDPPDDWYEPYEANMDPNLQDVPSGYTGYGPNNWGDNVVIKPGPGPGQMNSSWYFPWRPPGQQGAADYRENIQECVDPELTYSIGDVVDTEPGAMVGPTRQGFQHLIDQDPGQVDWDSNMDCLKWVSPSDGQTAGCIESSPRMRPVPMFDPTEAPDPGMKPFVFTNFAKVFVDRIQGNEVYAYIMPGTGAGPASPDGETAGPNTRILQLVE